MLQAPTTETKKQSESSHTAAERKPQPELHPHSGAIEGVSAAGMPASVARSGQARLQHFAALQTAIGNQAVLRMLNRSGSGNGQPGATQPCHADSGRSRAASPPRIQPKLTINKPGDQYEQEADRMAEQVMRMPIPAAAPEPNATSSANVKLQRQCSCGGSGTECEACKERCEDSLMQTKAEAPPIVHEVLRSPGQPLDAANLGFFEPRFGYDFSNVRLHSGPQAAQSAREIGAQAYTVGPHIVLGSGAYSSSDREQRTLLAHELSHVIQQQSTVPLTNIGVVRPAVPANENLQVNRIVQSVVQRAVKKGCVAPSFVVTPVAASAFGTVAEAVIEADYLKAMGGTPFADVFFDNPVGPISYVAFLVSHHPSLNTASLAIQIGLSGGVLVPDILDTRTTEFYDVKPDSPDGRLAGRGKLAAIDAFMSFNSLPYARGLSYTPTPSLPLPVAVDVFLKVLSSLAGGGIPSLVCGFPVITLQSNTLASGLLVYQICIEADFDCYLKVLSIELLIAAAIIAAILTAGGSVPETVPALAPALGPILAADNQQQDGTSGIDGQAVT